MHAGTWFLVLCIAWAGSELWLGWRRRSTDAARTRDAGTLRLLLVTIWASVALGVFVATRGWLVWPATVRVPLFWTGLALMAAGMIWRFWSVRVLAEFFTVDVTIRDGHRIVRDGPYRWLRHPSYTGALATFLGFSLALGNTVSLLVVMVPVTLAFLWRMRIEERVLADAFPDDWPRYLRETKRLVPFVW